MPVNEKQTSGEVLYQRELYCKGGIGRWYWDYKDEKITSLLDKKDHFIVDIGCGEGILLEKMVRLFSKNKVQGIDVFDENITICRNLNLPVQKGSVYNLNLETDSVDAITFIEVIEHLDNTDTALKEINRVLKPGGKVIIVFPNDAFFKIARILTLKFKEAVYDPGHVKQWTHLEMKKTLTRHGFDVVSSKSEPFVLWPISLHGITLAKKRNSKP